MSDYARRLNRDGRRCRPVGSNWMLESLEARTLLSGTNTGASAAASQARVASVTVLKSSLPTAVTGAKVTFTASVQNAANGAPIGSGKIDFQVEGPQKIDLGDVNVSKEGLASVSTDLLTKLANYHVEAVYTPTNATFSGSTAAPVTVTVIPLPRQVPTAITVSSGAPIAEAGQAVPIFASVKNAGTGNQVNVGKEAILEGTIEFVTVSPHPIVLGKIPLNVFKKTSTSNSNLLSIFGISSTPVTVNEKGRISITTNLLKEIGPNQIEAKFLPDNEDYAPSTSAPVTVMITPQTQNAPTVTTLQTQTGVIETGEPVMVNMTVQNANSSLAGGTVKFFTVSPHPILLGKFKVGAFDQQVSLETDKLQQVGIHQIQANYQPSSNRFAKSSSEPVTITVTPLTAASFRVTPVVHHGYLNQPVSFQVTALNAQRQPVTNYLGTIAISSPTDSWTIFPRGVYVSLGIGAPSPETTGLASFTTTEYTFTPQDHGTHLFPGGVTFAKGGAEVLRVAQANNSKVHGETSVSIS